MKKILNGRLYDTTTARCCGSDGYGDAGSFSHWTETLYQKRTGEYFLHGEGGAMTKYATSAGDNSWTWGERIIPMSYEKAAEWAEQHLGADAYAAIFGDVPEDDSTTALHAVIPTVLAEKLKRVAAQRGQSITDVLVGMLGEL